MKCRNCGRSVDEMTRKWVDDYDANSGEVQGEKPVCIDCYNTIMEDEDW